MIFPRFNLLPFLSVVMLLWGNLCAAAPTLPQRLHEKLAALEASTRGRIGLSVINTADNRQLNYRANERFPMGCTSKVMGVAAVLKRSMTEKSLLEQKIVYKKDDLASWSPITGKGVEKGLTIAELCAAAITVSDNTAMNLLVHKLGGLNAINTFARSIGNDSFRMDNDWPAEAKSGGPGNVYDSSTPAAMAKSLQILAFGQALAPTQRTQLLTWLKNNTTGNSRIRAGVPKGWIVGDKTGTGSAYGTTNDLGVIWPPHCAPIIVALYYTTNHKEAAKQEAILAETTRIVLDELAQTDSCIQNHYPIASS